MCYNDSAVRPGVKPTSDLQVIEERVEEKPSYGPSGLAAVSAGNPADAPVYEDASRFCPVCSQRLESRRCKLVCNVCGYYMSCADYY